MSYTHHDGGRSQYYKGTAGDCAARAMAIALQLDYKQCYKQLAAAHALRTGKRTAREGIHKKTLSNVLAAHGWIWHAAPQFDGRKARASDIPGRAVVSMAKHFAAVIDGEVFDIFDSSNKMVYGYWSKP